MLVLIQLVVFAIVGFMAYFRGLVLSGRHLMPVSRGSDVLTFTGRSGGIRYARHVGLAAPGAIPFMVQRERFYHRLLKHLGIASEIQVGNAGFDQRYFITTDFPGQLGQLLASNALQTHVAELFTLPVTSLHTTRSHIWCAIAGEDYGQPERDFEKHVYLLRQIARESQASLARERPLPATPQRSVAALGVIAVHAGLLTLGIAAFFTTLSDPRYADAGAVMQVGAVAGAVAAAVWLLSLLVQFRGSSWSAWVLADFLLFGLAGFVLSGIFAVREANVHLPQPAARLYQVTVQQKTCVLRCGPSWKKRSRDNLYPFGSDAECSPPRRAMIMAEKKRSDPLCTSNAWFTFRLQLADWREQGQSAVRPYSPPGAWLPFTLNARSWGEKGLSALGASEQLFDAVKTGDAVTIPVHPGALGLEWINHNEISAN